jgi:hypothetical protein
MKFFIMKSKCYVFACALLMLITGCSTTDRVQTLSVTCLTGLKSADQVGYSFSEHCLNRAFYQKDWTLEVKDIGNIKTVALSVPGRCTTSIKIDSARIAIQHVLIAYFDALRQLSADETVNYNVEGVTRFLKKDNFLGLEIDDKTVNSANLISAKLLKALTGGYRNRKIKKFITESDTSVSNLINILDGYYELLGTAITNNSSNIVEFYTPFRKDSSPYLISMASTEMFQKLKESEKTAVRINQYRKILRTIRDGHADIAKNANTLSKKELQKLITTRGSEIFKVLNELNNLLK